MEHTRSIEQTLSAFHAVLSGEKDRPRPWEEMRSLFYPGARLFPNSVSNAPSGSPGLDIDTYIGTLDRFLGQNDFFETGTITQVVVEGNIAGAIGRYEARRTRGDSTPYKSGILFAHLLQVGEDWKITSMIWRDE